jgi:hypothetical protein
MLDGATPITAICLPVEFLLTSHCHPIDLIESPSTLENEGNAF